MNYKNLLFILFLFITNCTAYNEIKITKKTDSIIFEESFINKGFALVYSEKFYKDKIVSSKINDRDLIIFQKNLKKGTVVKIRNILNNKSVIAEVGLNSNYPFFNNSVISKRIADEIKLDINEPYIEILEILNNSSFVAKKAKTFDEEKQVANKAPVDSISINNLNQSKDNSSSKIIYKFNYTIKIADFYFKDTAKSMINRIKNETLIKKVQLQKLSKTKYRVFLGPFYDIKSLQKAFNGIDILKFENIEIIKK